MWYCTTCLEETLIQELGFLFKLNVVNQGRMDKQELKVYYLFTKLFQDIAESICATHAKELYLFWK